MEPSGVACGRHGFLEGSGTANLQMSISPCEIVLLQNMFYLDNVVYATSIRNLENLLLPSRGTFVVDEVLRAELLGENELLIRRRRCNDGSARSNCNL